MEPLLATNGVVYRVGTEAEMGEMVGVLVAAFVAREPLALAVGLTAEEFGAFVNLLAAHVVPQGLTIVARCGETGEMAGVLLAEDSTTPPPIPNENEGTESLSPKMNPIFDILGRLDAEYSAGRVRERGEGVHLYLLGVAERFGGQGIGQELVTRCVENAAQRGYRVAVAEATSRTSQHIFRKLGFAERVWGSYGEHRYAGQRYFAAFAEHGGPVLVERRLEANAGGGAAV